MTEEFYVEQSKGYEIGNFIMITPAIKALYDHTGNPIKVLFKTRIVKEMYLKCPFIEIINKPRGVCILKSSMINKKISDSEFTYNHVSEKFNMKKKSLPHTYVDSYNSPLEGEYVVIARGCLGKNIKRKDPGDVIYRHILKKLQSNHNIVFIGANNEIDRIKKMQNWINNIGIVFLNDIKASLGLIKNCNFMISNDTGMYHAAGALNTKIFVMWKDTLFEKNKSPGKNCTFSFKNNWKKDFDEWYKKQK